MQTLVCDSILKRNKNFSFVTLPSNILDKSGLPLKFQRQKIGAYKILQDFFLIIRKNKPSIFISCFPSHTKNLCLDSS